MTAPARPVSVWSTTRTRMALPTIVVLVTSLVFPILPLHAQESAGERPVTEALCPATAESWDILFLMDESQSLRRNDPNRDRVAATKRYIADLGEIADFGTRLRIRVALAAFGNDFDLRMDFSDLRQEGAIERMYEVVDGFDANDLNTDYVLALYGALDLDWSASCNRVVWLTDGQHDLGDAHKGDQSPRPYDGRQRRLTSRSVARAVEDLLIPAVCGVVDGTTDEVAPGYGDLRGRVEELGVEIEDRLYYVGELVPGDTRTLIDRMSSEDCGRPTVVEPIPEWPRLPMCVGLPDARLPAGRDVVWSGALPEGMAPVFVRSVIVQAAGDSPVLATDHPFQSLEGDGPVRRLTLDFSEEPWSAYSPASVAVRGEGVEEACVAAVLEPPSLEARVVTSPIFPDSPVEVVITANGRTLSVVDEGFLGVSVDGEAVSPVVEQGTVRIPEQDVGDHTVEVRLFSDHADPVITSVDFTVSPKPDGPILQLGVYRLAPVTDTQFTIPIIVDDDGRPGEIRLQLTGPIVGTDGSEVTVEVFFPNGGLVWSSGTDRPDALIVILGDSVQTPENHVLRLDYESHPSDPAGDIQTVPLAVQVDIDHPRNLVLERIIVAAMLALLVLVIWVWLYVINRIAGRIRRPRRDIRWIRLRVDEAWTLSSHPAGEGHRRPKHTPSRLDAGQLRAKRKMYIRVWKSPTVELSIEGSRRFVGLVGDSFQGTEIRGRSAEFPGARLRGPIVLVDVSSGPPFEGVVMAPTDPSRPTEDQLTAHAMRALERLQPPDRSIPTKEE